MVPNEARIPFEATPPQRLRMPMPKGYQGPQPLSDLQAFMMSNLRAQATLKAELIWLDIRPARWGSEVYSRRRAEIQADLAALIALIAARRDQEKLHAKGPQGQ